MSKVISASTIGKLIEYHYSGDEEKFKIYANFIADAYKEEGDINAYNLIRRRITGEYINSPKVVLDNTFHQPVLYCEDMDTVGDLSGEELVQLKENIDKIKNDN